ncbi:hypothetical protein AB9P05_23820 [Roseivirga sp. BDSF3-8]|uniref:hypothetical protein n=1 Tax=Roseivirga sp. BDSF3-8 TaxID=3241598 RepID=UPI003531A739
MAQHLGTKNILLLLLLIVCTLPTYGQAESDTLFIRFEKSDVFHHDEIEKHPMDPHPEVFFPFNGLHGYRLIVTPHNHSVYWIFSSYTPEDSSSPFSYIKVDSSYLAEKTWLTAQAIKNMPYQDIIRTFHPSFNHNEKVLMLWDTSQPEGEEVYLVRVYFDFGAYE